MRKYATYIIMCLLAWQNAESKPIVDPGVYVLQGVTTCRDGLGYCVFGAGCQVDKDFVEDNQGGHCDGLRQAYSTNSTKVSFVCCRYSGEPEKETYETTVSPYTISDNKLSNVDIELELTDEIPADIDPSTLVNIIGVITDKTGIVSLVTEPYSETTPEGTPPTTGLPTGTPGKGPQERVPTTTEMIEDQTTFPRIDATATNNLSLNEIPLDITFLVAKKKKKTAHLSQNTKSTPSKSSPKLPSEASSSTESTTEKIPQTSPGGSIDAKIPQTVTLAEPTDEQAQIETPVMPYPSLHPSKVQEDNKKESATMNSEVIQSPPLVRPEVSSGKNSLKPSISSSTPHPINLNTCGIKKTTSKRRRFENIFSRGSAYDFCWSAAIMLKHPSRDGSKFVCNGALVEHDLVITTATCLQRIDEAQLENYRVVLGDSILTDDLPYGIQYHDILKTIVHPQFEVINGKTANDIGIIRLRDHATLSQNVCLVCVPQENAIVPLDACLTTGFSQTRDKTVKSESTAGLLISRPVSNFNKLQCDPKSQLKRNKVDAVLCEVFDERNENCEAPVALSEPMICLSENKWFLTGIASYGSVCTGQSVVYTKLSSFADWIVSKRILLYGYITHKTA